MGTQIVEPALGSSIVRDDVLRVDNKTSQLNIGLDNVVITNWNNTSQPQVAAGSIYEIDGTFFEESTNATVGSWTASGTRYLYATPSGSSTTWALSATAPTWSNAKLGWYNGTARAFYKVVDGRKGKLWPQSEFDGLTLVGDLNATNVKATNNVDAKSLLVSDSSADISQVPTNGAYVKGRLKVDGAIMVPEYTRKTVQTQSNSNNLLDPGVIVVPSLPASNVTVQIKSDGGTWVTVLSTTSSQVGTLISDGTNVRVSRTTDGAGSILFEYYNSGA